MRKAIMLVILIFVTTPLLPGATVAPEDRESIGLAVTGGYGSDGGYGTFMLDYGFEDRYYMLLELGITSTEYLFLFGYDYKISKLPLRKGNPSLLQSSSKHLWFTRVGVLTGFIGGPDVFKMPFAVTTLLGIDFILDSGAITVFFRPQVGCMLHIEPVRLDENSVDLYWANSIGIGYRF